MTGYQEILTDPSYAGQMVTMTYPLIGNYGVAPEDVESGRPWLSSRLIVREWCAGVLQLAGGQSIHDYLARHGIPGDQRRGYPRADPPHLREAGSLRGVIHVFAPWPDARPRRPDRRGMSGQVSLRIWMWSAKSR